MSTYDVIVIGGGPYTQGLGLENHEHRSSVPGIWLIGDVTSGPMLAHKAEDEAIACVEMIVGKAGEVNYDVIPCVIYTHPEVATVGRTEEQLKAEGRAYNGGQVPLHRQQPGEDQP